LPDIDASAVWRHGRRVCAVLRTGQCADSEWSERQSDTCQGTIRGRNCACATNVRAIGTYAKGCLSGGVALPISGPNWQVMRLSRNRNWGHPRLVRLLERLANDARRLDGWPGLLIGDMAQPPGGPMITGHESHQIGLDADIWLTPMPNCLLTRTEREDLMATSMLADPLTVVMHLWTQSARERVP
jgi:murein endopeptidase